MKFGVKRRCGRLISVAVMSAVLSTLLPPMAYAADSGSAKDDGGGVFDTVTGWFSDDEDAAEAAAPPKGPKLDLPQDGKLPKGKKKVKPERVKELKGKRTSSARFWRMSDGSVEAELSAFPTAYRSGKSWKSIDTTVRATESGAKGAKAGFDLANTTNRGRSYFGSDPGKLMRFAVGEGASVTFGLVDPAAKKLKPKSEGDTVTYEDAVAGADLSYEVGMGEVKENITLAERPGAPVQFTFTLDTEHLRPKANKNGSIDFYGEGPRPVLHIPAPFMMDAKESDSSPYGHVYSTDVEQKLTRHGDDWRLTLTPDMDWLKSKKRQYPVVIDPTVSVAPTAGQSQDVMVLSGQPNVNFAPAWNMSVGNTESGGVARSLLQFPLDEIPEGVDVKSARLEVYFDQTHNTGGDDVTIEAHRVTGDWTETGATWEKTKDLVGELSGTTVQIDDGDKGTAAEGVWPRVGTLGVNVGNDFAYNKNSATGESYTWQPQVPSTGSYHVEAHVGPLSDATTAAPYTVHHNGTTHSYTVDQSADSPEWKRLTSQQRTFDRGTAGKVVLGDTGDPDARTIADAVRLVNPAQIVKNRGEYSKWHRFPVADTVQKWVSGSETNHGFILKAKTEGDAGPEGGPRYEPADSYYGGETSTYPRLTVSWGKIGTELDSPTVVHGTGPELTWDPYENVSGDAGEEIVEYQIHRSSRQSFTPSAATLVAPVDAGATGFTDTTAVPTPADHAEEIGKSYYYQIAVKTKSGELLGSPSRLVGIPKAGRTMKLIQADVSDTTLASGQPNTNHDGLMSFGVGQTWLEVGNNSGTYGTARAVMKFPTGDIPDTATVLDSTMYMWAAQTTTTDNGSVYELRPLDRSFDEKTATWNHASSGTPWTDPGGDYGSVISDTTPQWSNEVGRHWWGATSMTQGWISDPASNHGAMVKLADESGPGERTVFVSSEGDDWQLGPLMRVIYVDSTPESTYFAPQAPSRMIPGDTHNVEVTLTNTTSGNWSAAEHELSYRWSLPDGTDATTGGNQIATALPDGLVLPPGDSVTVQAQVKSPINSASGNKRTDYVLTWDVRDKSTGAWLSDTGGIPGLAQDVVVEDPTSNQLGLESFYSYAGKNTGGGSTVMNNLYAGNNVWSYNAFANPGRGLSTFARFSYNSLDTSDTVLGHGWSAQLAAPLRAGASLDFHPNPNPTTVTLPDGDGTSHTFRWDDTAQVWEAPAGVHYLLEQKPGVDCKPSADGDPRAWSMTRPDRTRFYYDCDGYLTSIVDKNGNTQTYTYAERKSNNKPKKFLSYITDPAGRQSLTVEYYDKGETYTYIDDTGVEQTGSKLNNPKIIDHIKSMTDISGRELTFVYTEKGLLGQLTDGAGTAEAKVFAFTYDATQGNKNVKLVEVTDPRGNSTAFDYYYPSEGEDPKLHWRAQTITDRLGHDTGFTYTDPDGQTGSVIETKVTDAENHTTTYTQDGYGRPIQITNAKSQTVKLSWDADNNVTRLEEDNGAVTTYAFDPKTGYPTSQKDAEANANGTAAQTLEYQTALNGYVADLWRKTSPEGRTSQFGYDSFGNLTSVTDPKGVASAAADDFTTTYAYNGHGQLTSATDANGNTTTNSDFGPTGYPATITDALDNSSAFVYDERGQVLKVTGAQGGTTTQTYDVFGRPLVSTVPKDADAGEFITTPAPEYDKNGNVTKSFAPNGAVYSAAYDAADQMVETVAPADVVGEAGRKTTQTYDKVGNVLTVTEPKGNQTAEVGDYTTTYSYDTIYQPIAVTNSEGDKVTSTYDNVGNLTEVVDPKKNATADTADYTTKYAYDLNHRVTKVTDAVGNSTSRKYDKDSLVVSSTDADGNTTLITHDERGMTTRVKVPHSKDGSGNITYRTTEFVYDEVGNRTKVISPRGVKTTGDTKDFTTETVYDALNRVKEKLSAFDTDDAKYNTPSKTTYGYDSLGRMTKVSSPPSDGQSFRNETTYSYYDNGWTKSATDPFGITTSYDYNALGQQTKNTLSSAGGSSSRTMTWEYYVSGNLKARTDSGIPVGLRVALVDSSDLHNTAEQGAWEFSDAPEQWGYNQRTNAAGTGADRFVWQLNIPQDGSYEVFVRHGDVAGAATDASFEVTHSAGTTAKTVDQTAQAGEWVSIGSYDFTVSGAQEITLTDDANGTVVADAVKLVRDNTGVVDNEEKDFTYQYDANGMLVEVGDLAPDAKIDTYSISYTPLNQLAKVVEKADGVVENTTAMAYDANGNPLTTTHDLTWSKLEYNTRDLVTKITNADSPTAGNQQISTFTYTKRGQPERQVKPNGNTVDFGFYLDGAVKSQVEKTDAGTLVAQHDLSYGPNGNRTKDVAKLMNADDSSAYLETTSTFSYDPLDRIARVEKTGDGAGTETYVHDANHNVVSQTVGGVTTTSTYDRNRLIKASTDGVSTTYNYDPLGRLDTVSSGGTTQQRYTYDGFDRVAEVTAGSGASAATTSYLYDAFDRTTSKTTSGTDGETTAYTYLGMGSEVLREEVAGKAEKSYQQSPWGKKLTLIKHKDTGEEYSQYTYHPKGDVEAITKNSDGTTRATYGYTAYGSAVDGLFTGVDKPGAGGEDQEPYNPFRFNAHRWDASSGTYDMGFRNYDPGLNRFLTRDMYGGALGDMGLATDPFTGNRYSFAGGNPISFVEINGHFFGMDIDLSDVGHAVLDVAGNIPVVGWAADGANAIWYAAEGNYVDAALSASAMIPVIGGAATAARAGKTIYKAVDSAGDAAKATDNATDAAKAADNAGDTAKSSDSGTSTPAKSNDSPDTCPNSFVPGTHVVMADGTTRAIEDLEVGDLVWATDPETGDTRAREVTDTRDNKGPKHLVTLTVDTDGDQGDATEQITSTDEHPYWLPDAGRWAEAEDLHPGTLLRTSAGTWVQVTAVDHTHRTERVHNLTIAGVHSYYVLAGDTSLLVHNCGTRPDGPDPDGNIVYRALAKSDDPAAGLTARDPGNMGVSPLSHVAGKKKTPWISTSKNPNIAFDKYNQGHGVVAIDLRRIAHKYTDISSGPFPSSRRHSAYARKDSEVLVWQDIPAEAIVGHWPGG